MTTSTLPRWDLTTIYPSLESPEFRRAFDKAIAGIAELAALFDRYDVRRRTTRRVDEATVRAFEETTNALNSLLEKLDTLAAYIYCHVSTDARNDAAQTAESLLLAHSVRLQQLDTRYTAWVGTMDVEALLAHSAVARDHEFMLRKAQIEAAHQMSEAEESLAAELAPSSIAGWARLHGTMTSLLTAKVEVEGAEQTLPMSSVRALASHPSRDVRKNAYEAELAAWES